MKAAQTKKHERVKLTLTVD